MSDPRLPRNGTPDARPILVWTTPAQHVCLPPLSSRPVDLALALIASLIAATAVTWLIFRLSRSVERWTRAQFVLFWIGGIGAIALFAMGTAHVQTTADHYTTRCLPGRDANCRATGVPRVSASGDTACCYPGITEFSIEHTTAAGEATKIALIMFVVGTLFGLVMLGGQWMRRLPPRDAPPLKRKRH